MPISDGIRYTLRGFRSFFSSTTLVSNFLAVFLVAALVALLIYTVVGEPGMVTAIIGFSSGTIGAITGFYFNKDQLTVAQREQSVQGGRAAGYSDELQVLQSEYAALTARYQEVIQLLGRAAQTLPVDAEL
jgi:hypothetical protein